MTQQLVLAVGSKTQVIRNDSVYTLINILTVELISRFTIEMYQFDNRTSPITQITMGDPVYVTITKPTLSG